MVGFGVLLASTRMFLSKGNRLWLRVGIATAAVVAFGTLLVSNVQIRSDFLWYIGLLFAIATSLAVTMLKSDYPSPARSTERDRCDPKGSLLRSRRHDIEQAHH